MLNREHVTDALVFWERGRVIYNLGLVAISLAIFFRAGVDVSDLAELGIVLLMLAVIANLLYCVAYPIDLFVQASDFREAWLSVRWALLALGTLVGVVLAYVTLGGPHIFGFPGMAHG